MRVGIIGLLQEANTFLPTKTTLEHFRQETLLTGEAIRERFADAHHEIGGFLAGLAAAQLQAVPIFLARALPFGAIESGAHRELLETMLRELESQLPLDGLLVACHGANVAEDVADVDGHWLAQLRQHIGSTVPIIATIDPHANLSPAMVAHSTALVAYRTNPHTDQRACGEQAARMMSGTLSGTIRPTQAACFPPLAINIECQHTASQPCATHYRAADAMLAREEVLSNSIVLGFPYADVPEMGSAAIVVTDNRPELAHQLAGEMGQRLWDDRQRFQGNLIDVPAALAQARNMAGPVCLLDMGDNVGGGGPGDGTLLLHALHEARLGPAVVCVCDPVAVEHAAAAGIGAKPTLSLGGKSGPMHGAPFIAESTVVRLCEGRFKELQPRHGGYTTFDQGPTAVIAVGEHLTVVLTTHRMVPFSVGQLTSCEIDPAGYQVIVAKGVHAPVAAYEQVCRAFIRVNTSGATTADMTSLQYAHRRRPLWPFEQDFEWHSSQ